MPRAKGGSSPSKNVMSPDHRRKFHVFLKGQAHVALLPMTVRRLLSPDSGPAGPSVLGSAHDKMDFLPSHTSPFFPKPPFVQGKWDAKDSFTGKSALFYRKLWKIDPRDRLSDDASCPCRKRGDDLLLSRKIACMAVFFAVGAKKLCFTP